jgi:hypothetical protein
MRRLPPFCGRNEPNQDVVLSCKAFQTRSIRFSTQKKICFFNAKSEFAQFHRAKFRPRFDRRAAAVVQIRRDPGGTERVARNGNTGLTAHGFIGLVAHIFWSVYVALSVSFAFSLARTDIPTVSFPVSFVGAPQS